MQFDLDTIEGRKKLIEFIESEASNGRRSESYKQSEIMADRCKQFVVGELLKEFSNDTVNEMPVVSSINISKKIVDQEAIIYKDAPQREFLEVNDEQAAKLKIIYIQFNHT